MGDDWRKEVTVGLVNKKEKSSLADTQTHKYIPNE